MIFNCEVYYPKMTDKKWSGGELNERDNWLKGFGAAQTIKKVYDIDPGDFSNIFDTVPSRSRRIDPDIPEVSKIVHGLLDILWRDFNVIDGPELPSKLKIRSSMIGDIYTLKANDYWTEDRHFVVDMVGFLEITCDGMKRYVEEVSLIERITCFNMKSLFNTWEIVAKF